MAVTQKTIAEQLGLSVNAVSLALRNHPSISKATRERVRATANDLGYQVNPLVSALISSRFRPSNSDITTIAYVTFCNHLRHNDNARKRFYKGVVKRANELGFSVEEFCLADKTLTEARLERILLARGIRALMLAPPSGNHASPKFNWDHFSVVAIGRRLDPLSVNRVTGDVYHTYYAMMHELYETGYRRPALFFLQKHDRNIRSEVSAVFEFFSRNYFKIEKPLLYLYDHPDPSKDEIRSWLREAKPDVVLSQFPLMREVLREEKQIIPDDVGYVNLVPNPPKGDARINNNGLIIGATAVDLLTAQIYRNERGLPKYPKITQIEGKFMKGRTVRKSNRAAR